MRYFLKCMTPPFPAAPPQYNVASAAALLGVSRVSIWRWMSTGRLRATRLGHRTVSIGHEDLLRAAVGRRDRSPSGFTPTSTGLSDPRPGERAHGQWSSIADAHVVQFYETDSYLADAVATFLARALIDGGAAVVVATPDHRRRIEEQLAARGIDTDAAAREERYVALDAAETLAKFMDGAAPDAQRFAVVVGGVLDGATRLGSPTHVFGEMVALLAKDGNGDGAIRLEQLWSALHSRRSFSLLCAYPIDGLEPRTLARLFDAVCDEHSLVIPAESYAALGDEQSRLRAIANLQQRTRSLTAALAQEEKYGDG